MGGRRGNATPTPGAQTEPPHYLAVTGSLGPFGFV